MKLIISAKTGQVIGTMEGEVEHLPDMIHIDPPEGFDMGDYAEWAFDGTSLTRDPAAALNRAKDTRRARIKTEAGQLIAASDWKLQRAKERESGGWATLGDVDKLLAARENIRRSSGAAEVALDALTDVASVQAFAWAIEQIVKPARRLTQVQFASRFTDTELQSILSAAAQNPALGAWWEKFKLAKDIDLEAHDTKAGVQALEFVGLLAAGRTEVVFA